MKYFIAGFFTGALIGISVGIGANCCLDDKTVCNLSKKTKKLIKNLAKSMNF
ncbi:MAG: hypothetical protein LBJ09_00120 [Clostridiales bacterium]|jgi:hypothetical protein|nr:hypothetical protein [Clostridiales bacterium]